MTSTLFVNAQLVFPDRVETGSLRVDQGRINGIYSLALTPPADRVLDLGGFYLAPGFIDLHVHGGDGADFMDGTVDAFDTVRTAHLRHGTTSLLPTSTVARHDQILTFLQQCRASRSRQRGAKILGAHFYGPYFAPAARGCHPADSLRPPHEPEFAAYLEFADSIRLATIAPELPGAEEFAHACSNRGIRLNAGHSHASFDQLAEAIGWGVRHVDHLFCAMSDRARLRQTQPFPMRGGVLEATLFFDELTTEVIADGKHLSAELLKLAYKVKGPDRLALVTDCNRALDMPDGEYLFGPLDGGERVQRRDGVGLTFDGQSLASSVVGMDEMVRVFHRLTGAPLAEVIRMATLTPARIAGVDADMGSLEVGKAADFVILDRGLNVRSVYIDGTGAAGSVVTEVA